MESKQTKSKKICQNNGNCYNDMGVSIIITAILQIFISTEYLWYIIVIEFIIGLIIIFYGLLKYNKGVF